MKFILKVLGGLVGLLLLFVLGTFVAARFHDGPMDGGFAIVSGGPFSSGEMHEGPEPDWSFLKDSPLSFSSWTPIAPGPRS